MGMCSVYVWADICHMSAPQSDVPVVTVVAVGPEGRSALAQGAGHIYRSGGEGVVHVPVEGGGVLLV